jgi:hypothetical protein
MEYVIKELLHPEEDDEANFIYSELDSQRRETRRVEFYPSGMCFAYGGDMGQDEVLDPTPFPEDLRTLNRPGEVTEQPDNAATQGKIAKIAHLVVVTKA